MKRAGNALSSFIRLHNAPNKPICTHPLIPVNKIDQHVFLHDRPKKRRYGLFCRENHNDCRTCFMRHSATNIFAEKTKTAPNHEQQQTFCLMLRGKHCFCRRKQFILTANDGMTVRMAVYPLTQRTINITVNRFRIEEYAEADKGSGSGTAD